MGKPTKAQKAALLAVCREIADYVTSIGGTVTATRDDGTTDATVPTAAGTLALTIFPDGWIAGRFEDDLCALLGLGNAFNHFSLKYNLQGTEEVARKDPQTYKRQALAYIDRAVKAQVQDAKIRLRSGPGVTVESVPIVYEGSAAEWLSAPYSGPWQDKGVVKSLLARGSVPLIQDLRDRSWFIAERLA